MHARCTGQRLQRARKSLEEGCAKDSVLLLAGEFGPFLRTDLDTRGCPATRNTLLERREANMGFVPRKIDRSRRASVGRIGGPKTAFRSVSAHSFPYTSARILANENGRYF